MPKKEGSDNNLKNFIHSNQLPNGETKISKIDSEKIHQNKIKQKGSDKTQNKFIN